LRLRKGPWRIPARAFSSCKDCLALPGQSFRGEYHYLQKPNQKPFDFPISKTVLQE